MHVDFSQLTFDSFGRPEAPVLMLQKPHGEIIGTLGHYTNLKLELKYNDTSTGSFEYPRKTNGSPAPFYDQLVVDKLVRIDPYGVFIVEAPEDGADGVKQSKTITMQSLEYELAGKKAIFAQGTYNLWNPADQENTLLHIALESARNWSVGEVSASLIGRYRTFDDTDSDVLSFLRGSVQKSYGCVFVFDTYNRKVHVYDATEEATLLPIYFSYDNLLKEGNLREIGESLITKLYVQGAEGVDIRNVNPTGDNYLYNLDWYIQNGDLGDELGAKWTKWQNAIFARQAYYTELVALRSAATGRLAVESAKLTDLKNELSTLENVRAAWLQQQNSADHYNPDDPDGAEWEVTIEYAQKRLEETAAEYENLRKAISAQQGLIDSIQSEVSNHASNIASVNEDLSLKNPENFESDELDILDHYFKEDTLQDETFAVYDVAVGDVGSFTNVDVATLTLRDITWTPVNCESEHHVVAITHGTLSVSGTNVALAASIVRGTIDCSDDRVVCSVYLDAGTLGDKNFPSGNVTLTGTASYDDDVLATMTKHEDTKYSEDEAVSRTDIYYTGDVTIIATDASLYFTQNTTEYQRYSVEQDLYDHAEKQMLECAFPAYEFEVSSENILYAKQFEAFRNKLQLGCRCYLQIDEQRLLTPVLIELHFDFEKQDGFELVFANKFRRPDNVNNLKDALANSSSAARKLNLKKLAYGENNNTTTWVKSLLDEGFSAAMTQINSGKSAVTIDEAGIKVESADGKETIFLGNGMIALRDQRGGNTTLKMAMGHFKDPSGADYVGILADVIAGTLIAGENLIIECKDPNGGVMQFKVDSSGVVINNGCFYMQDNGRAVCIDPTYGFMLGKSGMLEWADDGTIRPVVETITADGFDDQDSVSVWLSPDGDAYFKGNGYFKNGYFNGIVQAQDFLDAQGASIFDDNSKIKSDYLDLGNIQLDGESGDITMTGNINLSNGKITWAGGKNSPITYQYSSNNTSWHDNFATGDKYRRESYDGGITWGAGYQFVGNDGRNGSDASVTWNNVKSALQKAADTQMSFITADSAGFPTIYGGKIYGAEFYGNEFRIVPVPEDEASDLPEGLGDGTTSALALWGPSDSGVVYERFRIQHDEGAGNGIVRFMATGARGAPVHWNVDDTTVYGNVNFTNANVTGLYFRFS